jgi:hypothetical protein
LSLVGAVLYGLLVVAHNLIGDGKVGGSAAIGTQPNLAVVRRLSSWGSSLPELVISQQAVSTHRQQSGDYVSAAYDDENPNQNSEQTSDAPGPSTSDAQSTASAIGGVKPESIAWAKITLAARGHSEASVSSAIIRFFRPGTELQVVSQNGGWLQLADPSTQERTWVFDKYVSLIDGPNPTQVAVESTTENNEVSKPRPSKPVFPSSRKLSRSAKPTVQASDDVAAVGLDARGRRWARRNDRRRGGFGLFMLGRSARFETAAQ